ncbi:MAG TPA: GyrI-like domain-containing protein [Vicinamibacterales bacterium]|nr:GyrI-like domain-containing protein [Vicinamibacterales bacterium]
MNVEIRECPQIRIAGIRHIGPYNEIGRSFQRLGSVLKGPPPEGSQMIAVFHDDPATTPADRLRSDAAMTLPNNAKTPDGLIEQRIPAGRYARTVHKGPYEGLPATWNALKNEWLPKSGHKMGTASYELYVNNPMTTEKSELVTEIYLRIG